MNAPTERRAHPMRGCNVHRYRETCVATENTHDHTQSALPALNFSNSEAKSRQHFQFAAVMCDGYICVPVCISHVRGHSSKLDLIVETVPRRNHIATESDRITVIAKPAPSMHHHCYKRLRFSHTLCDAMYPRVPGRVRLPSSAPAGVLSQCKGLVKKTWLMKIVGLRSRWVAK